jgi:hypothetical protein
MQNWLGEVAETVRADGKIYSAIEGGKVPVHRCSRHRRGGSGSAARAEAELGDREAPQGGVADRDALAAEERCLRDGVECSRRSFALTCTCGTVMNRKSCEAITWRGFLAIGIGHTGTIAQRRTTGVHTFDESCGRATN